MRIIKATCAEIQLLRAIRTADGDLRLFVQCPRRGAWLVTLIRGGVRVASVGPSFSRAWTALHFSNFISP
jgi:hypothetical protein